MLSYLEFSGGVRLIKLEATGQDLSFELHEMLFFVCFQRPEMTGMVEDAPAEEEMG
jgi:hypothetical protein